MSTSALAAPSSLSQNKESASSTNSSNKNGAASSPDASSGRPPRAIETWGPPAFFISTFILFVLAMNAMEIPLRLDGDRVVMLRFPRSPDDARLVASNLESYAQRYPVHVLATFFVLYFILQTFSIPGSVFLSIIAGALFPPAIALPSVLLAASVGACGAYVLSSTVARGAATVLLGKRLQQLRQLTNDARAEGSLFFWLFGARISPILPNWALNNGSGLVGVPLPLFFMSTLCGLVPISIFHVIAGRQIAEGSASMLEQPGRILGFFAVLGLLAFLPAWASKRMAAKRKQS